MIGAQVTSSKDGEPLDRNGGKLSVSGYTPPPEIVKLFSRCQDDYNRAWRLQHRGFDEFDGYSLLERARLDQQTFGAYVGIVQTGKGNWRWKGRKNTARNKVIGMLAHMLAGLLFPYCYAYNEDDEEDKMTAAVMRILIENHLKKASYEIKFLFMVCSALVNPAIHVEIEYVEALQKIKVKGDDGKWAIEEAVDEVLSGIGLHILPIDQILPFDFFTNAVQRQSGYVKVRRISWDEARSIYKGKHFYNGVDQFDFVQAGKTRIVMAGQEHQTLYDIEWTEADVNMVQELTFYYRPEDLEVTWVGGVFMGDYEDPYNSNPFKHRRMSMIGNKWLSIPIYPFAKSGFEPIDPAGRFYYYKSACFKEFWDDAAQNKMHQLAFDGTALDVMKPVFMSGVARIDSTVMVPGATVSMPAGAQVNPYQLGPNLAAALQMMKGETDDMSESTQDKISSGVAQPGVTAYAVSKAEQNAQVILGVLGTMTADLVKQVGELVMDDIIMHTTVGEVDASVPESLKMRYKTMISKGKEAGKDVTNKIMFSTDMTALNTMLSKDEAIKKANEMEWDMFEKAGGMESTQRNYLVDPYKFARHRFSVFIDPSMMISRSMGTDQLRKERAFNILMDPRVAPFVNQEAVVDKFVLEEYSDGDPDQFKKTQQQKDEMLNSIMGQQPGGGAPAQQQPVGAAVGQ